MHLKTIHTGIVCTLQIFVLLLPVLGIQHRIILQEGRGIYEPFRNSAKDDQILKFDDQIAVRSEINGAGLVF